MKNCDPLEQAEFICNIGQRIRNYFWGNISRKMAAGTKSGTMELLSLTQLQLLDTVTAHGRITITELARNMGVSPPSTSAMVDRMVNCGWLHRASSVQDRRKVLVSVSAEAKKNIMGVQEIVREEIIDFIKAIGPETTQKWCDVLDELDRACTRNSI